MWIVVGLFCWGAAAAVGSGSARGAELSVVRVGAPRGPARVMPADFTGLSYEMGQLYNAEYFSAKNTALVSAFRGLSGHGVLRLGGHLSNITDWEGVGRDEAKQVRGVRHGIEDYWEWPLVDPTVQRNKKGVLTRKALENMRGFLDAVNWRLMYGLNFACGSKERAADEARVVAEVMGGRLMAFLVGNEADGFGEDQFFRAEGYGFKEYFAEYELWTKTIRAKVPRAAGGGRILQGMKWVKGFAARTKGDAVLLTSHFFMRWVRRVIRGCSTRHLRPNRLRPQLILRKNALLEPYPSAKRWSSPKPSASFPTEVIGHITTTHASSAARSALPQSGAHQPAASETRYSVAPSKIDQRRLQ